MYHLRRALLTITLTFTALSAGHHESQEVTFKATDGGQVYAQLYPAAQGKAAPLIILYHQARANGRSEYGAIAPRLAQAGYNVLAVDQRSGGDHFGGGNRTVIAREGKSTGYCEAYPDAEGALSWAGAAGYAGKPVIWGSSYSAAIVVRLAAERGDEIAAALAFSPATGGVMGTCKPSLYADNVAIPMLALRPIGEMAQSASKRQFESFGELGIKTYVADPGVHGSSMLVKDRVKDNVEATWAAVLGFLAENLKQ